MDTTRLQYCTKCGHLVAKVAPRCPACGTPPVPQLTRLRFKPPKWLYWSVGGFFGLVLLGSLVGPDNTVSVPAPAPSMAVALPFQPMAVPVLNETNLTADLKDFQNSVDQVTRLSLSSDDNLDIAIQTELLGWSETSDLRNTLTYPMPALYAVAVKYPALKMITVEFNVRLENKVDEYGHPIPQGTEVYIALSIPCDELRKFAPDFNWTMSVYGVNRFLVSLNPGYRAAWAEEYKSESDMLRALSSSS